jgi:hypothetical protein
VGPLVTLPFQQLGAVQAGGFVLELFGQSELKIREKPMKFFFINAGLKCRLYLCVLFRFPHLNRRPR